MFVIIDPPFFEAKKFLAVEVAKDEGDARWARIAEAVYGREIPARQWNAADEDWQYNIRYVDHLNAIEDLDVAYPVEIPVQVVYLDDAEFV